ncbi:MAG: phosphatase, partial [Candidatus Aenigmatarchaeota archaeon]
NRAWDEYLDEKRGKAFVKREKIGTLEAIETILNSGGIPVMAHPIKLNDQELIPYFVKKGMIGIEVYYPEHGEETEQHYLEMSRKYDLVATGGSDSHGPGSVKPLDVGCANVPLSVYEDLKKIKKNL